MQEHHKIITELKNRLQQVYGSKLGQVILFGSRALAEAEPCSDFDILVVLEEEYTNKDEDKILDICYDLDLKYNILIDMHLISERELTTIRGKQPIFANAFKKGIYA
jgi:uncharacterized protein